MNEALIRSSRICSPRVGTAWLWSDRFAVTAAHATGVRGSPRASIEIERWGTARIAWRDFDLDLAILELETPVRGVASPALGSARAANEPWSGFGFPEANPEGLTMAGTVLSPSSGSLRGTRGLLELNYPNGGADEEGSSGTAVIINGRITGVVLGGVRTGKILLAAPAEWLSRYCPVLWSERPDSSIRVVAKPSDPLPSIERAAAAVGASVITDGNADVSAVITSSGEPVFVVGTGPELRALAPTATWTDVTFLGAEKPIDCASAFITLPSRAVSTEDFEARVSRRITDLRSAPGVPRRLREAIAAIESQCSDLLRVYGAESVFLQFLAGWLHQLPGELPKVTDTQLQTSTRYYRGCLRDLHQWQTTAKALAIADLSDDIEQWWINGSSEEMKVRERIFLLNPNDVIAGDEQQWTKVLACLATESRRYEVFVARPPTKGTAHPLGSSHAAWDIIVFPPGPADGGAVGGYVKQPTDEIRTRNVLCVSHASEIVRRGTEYFDERRNGALRFDPSWSIAQLREQWVKRYGVGVWDPCWEEIEDRPDQYFDLYDEHIRCWVPRYDQLLRLCSTMVRREILGQTASNAKTLPLLELGYGTGALTDQLTRWLSEYRTVSASLQNTHLEYVGLDPAPQMQRLAQDRLGSNRERVRLERASFPEFIPAHLISYRANIVLGSLVAHDIWGLEPERNLEGFFASCATYLNEDGAAIFADVFFSDSSTQRQTQVQWWRDQMRRTGLSDTEIEVFFAKNREMRDCAPSIGLLTSIAGRHGFVREHLSYADNSSNPFGVICFRRS